jgi:uncharacterized membrane protein YhfC
MRRMKPSCKATLKDLSLWKAYGLDVEKASAA